MNPLRPPSSSSRQGRAGQGRVGQGKGAARLAPVNAAAAARTDGDGSAASEPAARTAAASPVFTSLQDTGFPAWWTSSSPLGLSEGYVYLIRVQFYSP